MSSSILQSIYDEPFADVSQIPTYLVSKLAAREQVTVSLSGDGGDELFNGYSRYIAAERLWRFVNFQPRFLNQLVGILIRQLPVKALNVLPTLLTLFSRRLGTNMIRLEIVSRSMRICSPKLLQ